MSLGVCLGGNGTMIGGQRQRGHRRHGREGGLPHLHQGVSENGLYSDGHHGAFVHGVATSRRNVELAARMSNYRTTS